MNREESGQMAVLMALLVIGILAITGFSYDTGAWYFDHRTAQNQAEAAALAAVIELPAADTTAAEAAADDYLERNGAEATTAGSCGPATDDHNHIEFQDLTGDGKMDSATVCVRRHSPGVFARLSGISFVHVSASATARTGPVDSTNVMPWAVVAPDPTCTEAKGVNCLYDANGDGDYTDAGDCNAPWTVCPFGVTPDRLYVFKEGTGGNTGILRVCGPGNSNYEACLSGDASSGIYEVGSTVATDLQGGTLANGTKSGLAGRDPASAWALPGGAVCDVAATPLLLTSQSPGYDPDGKALATAKYVNPVANPQCVSRLVPVPIINALPPNGGGNVQILGVASFAVVNWYRLNGNSQEMRASAAQPACHAENKNPPSATDFVCGVVWGYLFSGVTPPDALLNQIGSSNNPFAPLLIALVD